MKNIIVKRLEASERAKTEQYYFCTLGTLLEPIIWSVLQIVSFNDIFDNSEGFIFIRELNDVLETRL